MRKYLFPFLIVFIITVPSFISLINGQYFSMHDDQHIARLFLLDQGLRQGNFYPRWVDMLGFGYGYPLYNFYPPLVYYLAEVFHLIGFSLIWAIKLVFISGFVISGWGVYLFSKKYHGPIIAFIPVALYTFFFYHGVNVYVRGALAEYFSMAILPFVFLAMKNLFDSLTFKNALLFAVTLALLVLDHPLIAFPSIFFITIFFFVNFAFAPKNKWLILKLFAIGGIGGLALSAFFWLPSMLERKYTYVDTILTHELASYKIHFIYWQQFWYSLWGYGGSIAGPSDGFTFQLGKMQIFLCLLAIILSVVYLFYRRFSSEMKSFYLFIILGGISLFMTTQLSSFVWDHISYLWYLQFPWRFLTFAGFFLSVIGGYSVLFIQELFFHRWKQISTIFCFIVITATIVIYGKYFRPQYLRYVSDRQLTSYEDIAWRISKTSFEFVPKGVRTTKTELNTTTLDIKENQLPKTMATILTGEGNIQKQTNTFARKSVYVQADSPLKLQLNTYDFPGWVAVLKNATTNKQQSLAINSNNDLRLITVNVPPGSYEVIFEFKNTPVRTIANTVSIIALVMLAASFTASRFSSLKGRLS